MRFKATDVYDYHRPKECRLRVYLRYHGVPEEPPGQFQLLLRRLGEAHERRHLAILEDVVNLSACDPETKERRTLESIRAGAECIYQGRFVSRLDIGGEECDIVGEPDFLIRAESGYVIQDSKLARNIDDRHPEILLQLRLYGWLYEQVVGAPPVGLQVHAGDGRIVPIPYDGGDSVVETLQFLREARLADAEFYEPVGWTKCRGCGYFERCWAKAEKANDVALLPHVSQRWARRLHDRGVTDAGALAKAFARSDLRDLFYEKATRKRPAILKAEASRIQKSAEARQTGAPVPLAPIELPDPSSAIMIDLEGLPAYSDEIEEVYLWGFKDFRRSPARYLSAQAGFGLDGDREGWEAFLRIAEELLSENPDFRFVHYGTYERTKIDLYRRRYEDPRGVAERLLTRLFDLYPALTEAVALPVASYGLKAVERYVGFERKIPEANGQWAIAQYIEAVESGDETACLSVLDQIKAYNQEDLDATWAVLSWLRNLPSFSGNGQAGESPARK